MTNVIVTLLILGLGLALLLAEDVLPTSGALGLLAVGCFAVVVYQGFATSTAMGYRYLIVELVVVPSVYAGWLYVMSRTPIGRRTRLTPPEPEELGVSHASPDLQRLVGQEGLASTPLRPSGMVDFEGKRLEAIAESGLIEQGSRVLAVNARSGRLIVRCVMEEIEI